MKTFSKLFACLSLLAMMSGCGVTGTPGTGAETLTPPKFVPGLPKGYECPLIPNGFDPAGSIFRLDKNGSYYRVADRSKDPKVIEGYRKDINIANYAFSDTQKSSAGLSFTLLENALPGLSASTKADFNKEVSVDITVEDLRGEVLYDSAADYIKDWFSENIKPKAGSRYYLVREVVLAGGVRYKLNYKDLKKFGGKAKLAKLAKGNADVTFNDAAGNVEIKQTFSPRIHVCIKTAEIEITRHRATRGKAGKIANVFLKPVSETNIPTIKRIGK